MGDTLAPRIFWFLALSFALIAGAGVAGLDSIVARYTANLVLDGSVWSWGLGWLDLVALKEISNFLLGAILLLAGGLLLVLPSLRRTGRLVLYVGLVQTFTTTIADLAKPQLGRLRPWELDAGAADIWFVGANSFPSGHTAFYAALFFPLILLLPRWTWLWVLPPAFVALSRILLHDHYLSDVAASLALAAAMTAAWARVAGRGAAPARVAV